jgi:hypothetical protein
LYRISVLLGDTCWGNLGKNINLTHKNTKQMQQNVNNFVNKWRIFGYLLLSFNFSNGLEIFKKIKCWEGIKQKQSQGRFNSKQSTRKKGQNTHKNVNKTNILVILIEQNIYFQTTLSQEKS